MRKGVSRVDDLLGLLLECNYNLENRGLVDGESLATEEIIEECKVFYLAGQETALSWLTWTIIVLAMHPDWQEKAREEVKKVCQNKTLDYEAISHLKIVSIDQSQFEY